MNLKNAIVSPRGISILTFWLFITLKIGIHFFLIAPEYDLHRDEYLHIDQAYHLDWGFSSVPPFTSWISYGIVLLGAKEWLVKAIPLFFGILTMIVVWKAVRSLGGGLYACSLAMVGILFSAVMRLNILYQPNSFDVLSWTLLYYTLLRYIDTQHEKYLWYMAISVAIGFLNKYNIVFGVVGLFFALLVGKQYKIFFQKHFYYAFLVGLLIIFPNVYWQYHYDFPVLGHFAALNKHQLQNLTALDFLKEQFLFFLGSFFVLLAAFWAFWKYPPFKSYRFFFYTYIFTILIFLGCKGKGYYAIGLYPIFFAFGSVFLEKSWFSIPIRSLSIIFPIITFLPILPIAFPISSPRYIASKSDSYQESNLYKWEDGKNHALPQDFADMLGWSELAQIVDSVYRLHRDSGHTFILCDNYGQAGAINFYSKEGLRAVSLSADYINWFELDKEIRNVILVQDQTDDDPERKKEKPLFERVHLCDSIKNEYAREKGTRIYILKGAKTSINAILKKDIASEEIFSKLPPKTH